MTAQLDTAVLVAVLVAGAVYLCLSRRFLRVLLGFLLLSNAANLVVLSVSGDPTGKQVATIGSGAPSMPAVDPVPQALILTAIVIGFSVAAYLTVLLYRIYVDDGSATMTGPEGDREAHDDEAMSR
jgi:multicomponent Na+:H+ antiporter subunit C